MVERAEALAARYGAALGVSAERMAWALGTVSARRVVAEGDKARRCVVALCLLWRGGSAAGGWVQLAAREVGEAVCYQLVSKLQRWGF